MTTLLTEKFQQLDLSCVKRYVKGKYRWSEERANLTEAEYRKWLLLCCMYPKKRLGMGNKDVDEMWHAHILNTRKYHKDCQMLCGRYIHHVPTKELGKEFNVSTYGATLALYPQVFGKEPDSSWLGKGSDEPSTPAEAPEETANDSDSSSGSSGGSLPEGECVQSPRPGDPDYPDCEDTADAAAEAAPGYDSDSSSGSSSVSSEWSYDPCRCHGGVY